MRVIIVGAGRGRRLMPLTTGTPKSYAEVGGRRILDWGLAALRANGLTDVVFVGGYQIDRVRADYPWLSFRHNARWEQNNILASLFHAEDAMDGGFISAYADILYRSELVGSLLAAPADIALVVNSAWRDRYRHRTAHPESDAEKVVVTAGRIERIGRDVDADRAHGEFVGLAKFSAHGADILRARYHALRASDDGGAFRGATSLDKAYLIDLFQDLIEQGAELLSVDAAGGYFEIDTTEDYELARRTWR